jgi:hypothetical protein
MRAGGDGERHRHGTMLGRERDPFADTLICHKADRRERADASAMSNGLADPDAMLCPACTRPMTHARTIWRAFQDDLQVFECRACSVSISVKALAKTK